MNIKNMIPFLEDEEIEELIKEILTSEDLTYGGVRMENVLPFADEDVLDEIAVEYWHRGGNVMAMLPFMSDDGVGDLARVMVEEQADVSALLPFMDEDDVDEVFLAAAREGRAEKYFYPFVSEDGWHDLMESYIEGEISFDFDDAYRFMDDDDIRELFRYEIKRRKNNQEP